MRTSVLATLLGLTLVGCAGEISGGGGDDDTPASCGNGVLESELGETCDDSNTVSGDGCSSTCTSEVEPRLLVTLDKTVIDTELAKTEVVKATFVSEGGFSGNATVALSIVDGVGSTIPLITLAGPASVSIAAGQTQTVDYPIAIQSNATAVALTGTWKLDVTNGADTVANLSATVNITPNFTMVYEAGTGTSPANHPIQTGKAPSEITLKRGATISYTNNDTIRHVTHGGGVMHEDTTNGGQPGQTYTVPTIQVPSGTTNIQFGCHDHPGQNNASYTSITVE